MSDYTQLTQDILMAWGKGDMDFMLNSLSDDMVLTEYQAPGVAMGGIWKGKDGFLGFLQALNQTLEFREFVPQQFIAQGSKVVIVGYEVMVARSTGTEYRNEWIHVWEYEGDKLARIYAYNDTAAVATAIGVLTPAAAPA
jgi:ketosteroid isomerase-like protein